MNIIVSGCPRSGTSMTMRILDAAGLEIATDKVRGPDHCNPQGYYEIDNIVNKLKHEPDLIFEYSGKVLKVIHYGLEYLPKGEYKIVYIERDLDEVMASMDKMIGQTDNHRESTKKAFQKLGEDVKKLIAQRDDMNVLYISHRTLLTEPKIEIERMINFLDLDSSKMDDMLNAIDKTLYRNKN